MSWRLLLIPFLVGAAFRSAAAEDAGSFGEFTLASGEKVVGYYHPDSGTFEVYELSKKIQVAPGQILAQRRLLPGTEPDPASLKELEARVSDLERTIVDVEVDAKTLQNRGSELEKAKQLRRLEQSKREESRKEVDERMQSEQDPARKVVYAALVQEELKAIAEAHAAIAAYESAAETNAARVEARRRELLDLQTRHDWLLSRRAAFSKDK